jgi:RimJ/RimL family protein N-acetyltransferase
MIVIGYGTAALQQMLQHIKQKTEIKEVYARTKQENTSCIRILENANSQNRQ